MPFSTILDKVTNERGLSGAIFKNLPHEESALPQASGFFWNEDFLDGVNVDSNATLITPKSSWTITQATAGTVALSTTAAHINDGVLVIDCDSTTAGQGINLQCTRQVKPTAGFNIGMEWRLMWEDIATPPQFILGLTDPATAALTGGATLVVNTTNVVDAIAVTNVLSNAADAGIFTYHDETGESAVQGATAIHTPVDGAFFKYGCLIEGTSRVLHFINGALVATFTSASGTIPTVALRPIIVCQTDGTTDPIIYLDSVSMAGAWS